MRNNPRDWRIGDLSSAGLVSVPCARPTKPVYIRQFVALIDKLEGAE